MVIMANYFADHDCCVTLLTMSDGRTPPFYDLDDRVDHIPLCLATDSRNPVEGLFANVTRVYRLRRAIRESRPEAVISFMNITNVVTLLATRGLGIPVLVSERTDPTKSPTSRIWRQLRDWVYPMADELVVLTKGELDFFSQRMRLPVRIIPNPVLTPWAGALQSEPSVHRPSIVAMGRLSPVKGFDLLLRAFASLCDKHPDWRVIILGEGLARKQLESLRNELGLNERVALPGIAKNPVEALKRADIFVMPSRHEGFPMSLCEAMACGLPVICTDCSSGPREIIRHDIDGLLVSSQDVNALAAAMDKLMSSESERMRLGSRAADITERFSLAHVMRMWEDLLHEHVSRRRAADTSSDSVFRQRQCSVANKPESVKILFVIRTLRYGGAERQMVTLAKGLKRRGHGVAVAVFYSGGPLENELREAGIAVRLLGKRNRWDVFGFLWRLVKCVRAESPDVLHGYLIFPNILTVLLRLLFPRSLAAWGVRDSDLNPTHFDLLERLIYRAECRLARFADLIIVNSRAGLDHACANGFPRGKIAVIPNGIDTERFCPDREAGQKVRGEWGVAASEKLIGLVARLHPIKDHTTFLKAAGLLARERSDVLGIAERVIWFGARDHVAAVYNALDVVVSSSSSEGFPNAIGEAMACGVPSVVTNVGDSAWVVGNTGEVVPAKDPRSLKDAIEASLNRRGKYGGNPNTIRQRIIEKFSVIELVEQTEAALNRSSRSLSVA